MSYPYGMQGAPVVGNGLGGLPRRASATDKISAASSAPYVRPADWPALPSVEGQQKFVGLFAVYDNGSNFLALAATGNYTVDWGDGTAPENVSSGVQADHLYSYAASGLSAVTAMGYKCAVVTITPNGGTLTNINLQKRHPQSGLSVHSAPWLDISINGPNLTTIMISASSRTINIYDLEVFSLNDNAVTSFSNMFHSCYSLASVPLLNTALGTGFSYMFNNCYSLASVPLLDTALGTNFSFMFRNCYALASVPTLNTALGTNFSSTFNNCYALASIPLLNTALGTDFSYTFANCYSLASIPLLDTALGTDFSNMFNSCSSLVSVPLLDTALGTSFSSMFANCYSLAKGAMFDTKANISYSGCKLGPAELNEVYTNLATVTAKTITVTGNWGAATADPSIATAKGWTVIG